MDYYQRLRTSQGRLPTLEAKIANDARDVPYFRFEIPDYRDEEFIEYLRELNNKESLQKLERMTHDPGYVLEDLGLCIGSGADGGSEGSVQRIERKDLKKMLEIANEGGPLFGKDDRESIASWLEAIACARTAVLLQKAINQHAVGGAERYGIVKERYVTRETGASCIVYSYSFCVGEGAEREYGDWISKHGAALPWSYRFSDEQADSDGTHAGRTDYAVFSISMPQKGNGEDRAIAYLQLFSFERDIPTQDFAALLDVAADSNAKHALENQLDDAVLTSLWNLERPRPSQLGFARPDVVIDTEEVSFVQDDASQLQHLVQALASLHIKGAEVDMFRSRSSEGFMAFSSYLCCLWFKFAQSLADIKVAFCPVCGRGFSKAKHRGPDKIYCSETCKAARRNNKRSRKRDEVRRLFLEEGLSVKEIRRAKLDGKPIGWTEQQIADALGCYPELKRACKKSPEFTQRCLHEKVIDVYDAQYYARTHPNKAD